MRILKEINSPLKRVSSVLSSVEDHLDRRESCPTYDHYAYFFKHQNVLKFCAGSHPNRTSNTMNEQKRVSCRVRENGFSRTRPSRSGRKKVYHLFCGFMAFPVVERASSCTYHPWFFFPRKSCTNILQDPSLSKIY